jgi:HEAT repeat protein
MSRSDRDPLFFPPQKYGEEPEPEEYSVDVDTAGQERQLRSIVLLGLVALAVVLLWLKADILKAGWAELRAAVTAKLATASLDSMPPQLQAERLLVQAARHDPGALEEIERRLAGWQGRLRLDQALWAAIGKAFESPDMGVRTAALEVDMVARGTPATAETVDAMITGAEPGQSNRPAALWALGELANRGVEPDRARQALVSYLHDPQEDIRHWAVEGLAMTGHDETIAPLVDVLRNDASPKVRESAARNLAAGGMFEKAQRTQAVPELVNLAEDTKLDAATRAWVFHALRDITGQNLPDDAAAWRKWAAGHGRS